jgi:hypothetical protein
VASVFHSQAATAGGPKHFACAAHNEAAAYGQGAVDGSGNVSVLDLTVTLEHAPWWNCEFGRADHRRFYGALDNEAFGIRDNTLDTDAATNNKRSALRWIARCWTAQRRTLTREEVGAEEAVERVVDIDWDMFGVVLQWVGLREDRRLAAVICQWTERQNPRLILRFYGPLARKAS